MHKQLNTFLLLAAATLLPASLTFAQGTISLRPRANLAAPGDVTLGMLADLSGPDAEPLANLVVVPAKSFENGLILGIARIRKVVEKAPGVNLGRLTLSGNACTLVIQAPITEAPAKPASSQASAPSLTGDSVKARINARLAELFEVAPQDLRVTFDEREPTILSVPLVGRVVAVEPAGNGDRIPMQVRIFEGDRLIETATVRTEPLLRRSVARASAAIAKGTPITESLLTVALDWLAPSVTPATPSEIIGTAATTRLSEGQIVETRHVQAPNVVSRGDICTVDCISGSIIVQVKARALANGTEGETIAFVSINGKRPFQARIASKERAVLAMGSQQ